MTTEPQRELNLADMIMAVFRWLTLVAAIALGVCLGIYMFFRMVEQSPGRTIHEPSRPGPIWSRLAL
jgi:hypothetical protein